MKSESSKQEGKGWISVETELPKKSGYVFAWSTSGCDKIWYNHPEKYFGVNSQFRFLVTHWQPLPQPPITKTKTNEQRGNDETNSRCISCKEEYQ